MNFKYFLLCCLLGAGLPPACGGEFSVNGKNWKTYSKGIVKQTAENEFLVMNDKDTAGAGIFCRIPAEPGRNYRVSAGMAAVTENRDGVYIQVRYLPSKKIHQQKIILPAEQRFQQYDLPVPAGPSGTNSLEVYFYAHADKITFRLRNPDIRILEHAKFDRKLLSKRPDGLLLDKNTVLVVPGDGSFDEAARQIREAAQIDFKIMNDMPAAPGPSSCIAIGNRNNNPLISYLYDRYYCIVDLNYPGPGGYVLRTLSNPVGDKADYVLAGGSDRAGIDAAIKRLAEVIREQRRDGGVIKLPFTWDIKLSPAYILPREVELAETYDQSEGYGTRYFGWSILSRYLAMFYATGDPGYARRFLELSFPKNEADLAAIKRDPTAFKTMDDPLGAPYHYNAVMTNIFWNMVEDHPVFSDEERAEVAEAMFRQFVFWRDTTDNGCGIYQVGVPADRIGNRHQQWAAVSLFTVARYLNKVYPNQEFVYAEKAAEHFFSSIFKYFFVEGEGGNLTWYPSGIEPVPFFMLLSGQKDKAAGSALGVLAKSLETLCGNVSGDRILQYVPLSLLRRTAYLLQDRAPLELEKLLNAFPPEKFRLGQSFEPAPPEYRRNSFRKAGFWYFNKPESEPEKKEWNIPFPDKNAAFSIASWRENDDGGDFIVVDGHLDRILRQPLHSMALFTLTLDRLPLLAGYRNQLWARQDGIALSAMPASAHLDKVMSLGESAGFASSLPVSDSAVWQRALLRRPGFCLITDRISENGTKEQIYDLDVVWEHGPGLKQQPAAIPGGVRLLNASMTKVASRYYVDAENNYHTIPAGIETVLLRGGVKALLFKGWEQGQRLIVEFETPEAFHGDAHIQLYAASDRGRCNIYIDDQLLGKSIQLYSPEPEIIDLAPGKISLAPGRHRLILEAETPSPTDSARFNIGFVALALNDKAIEQAEGSLSFADSLEPRFETRTRDVQAKLTGKVTVYSFPAKIPAKAFKNFFTLLSSSPVEKVSCRRINEHAALLALPEPAIAVGGRFGAMGLDGEILLASERWLSGMGVKQAGKLFTSKHPVNLDWNLDTGVLWLEAEQDADIQVDGRFLNLKNGRSRLEIKVAPESLAEYRKGFTQVEAAAQARSSAEEPIAGIPVKSSKTVELGAFPAAMVAFGDNIAVAAGKNIKIFDSSLNPVNCLTADSPVGALHYVSESNLLLGGCLDGKVIAFELPGGKRKWEFVSRMADGLQETGAVWYLKSTYPGIYGLSSGKFLDGRTQIFAGSASTVEILDTDGKLIKREKVLWGPVSNFGLFPVGGKIALAMSSFYPGADYLTWFDSGLKKSIGFNQPPRDARHFQAWGGINRTGIEVADLNGDDSPEVISGLNGVWNRIIIWDTNGRPLHEVSFGPGYSLENTLYGKQRLARRFLSDVKILKEKNCCKIIASTVDGVILFDHQLKKIWRRKLPASPLITAVGQTGIAVGCDDGFLGVIDFSGNIAAFYKGDSPWADMCFIGNTLIAVDASGKLHLPAIP